VESRSGGVLFVKCSGVASREGKLAWGSTQLSHAMCMQGQDLIRANVGEIQ
jgi:hypothetical protein